MVEVSNRSSNSRQYNNYTKCGPYVLSGGPMQKEG